MVKKLLLIGSSGLLKVALFSLALTGAGWMTFGTSDSIKKAADGSNVYDSVVTDVLYSAKKDAAKQGIDVPLDQPELEQAAKNAFGEDLLSKNSASIIDGIYGWLQGKTEKPEFSVDLTAAKQNFAAKAGDYAQDRYETLPACTRDQLMALEPDIKPFDIECRVPGLSAQMVRSNVLAEIAGGDSFLNDSVFTVDDLPKDEQGMTVTEKLDGAPEAYTLLSRLPWVFGAAALLFAVGVLFFSSNKRKGLRSIGITLLGTGIFLLLGSLILTWAFGQMNPLSNNMFEDSLLGIVKSLSKNYNAALQKFVLAYVLIGGGILIALWLQQRNKQTVNAGLSKNQK